MLTPKFRKSPAAERIRRLLHTCVGSLKIPRKGGRHVLIGAQLTKPTALRRGLFLAEARAYPKGGPGKTAGLAGERRSDRMSEPCRLRRGEGYNNCGGCDPTGGGPPPPRSLPRRRGTLAVLRRFFDKLKQRPTGSHFWTPGGPAGCRKKPR